MRLFCSEKQILAETEKLYCEAVAFYYELLKDRNELWTENLLTIQGQLEKLTVPGKDGRVPEYLPPGGKLPVYFRRSAMNKASMAVKTAAASGCFPQKIEANITFFKGMYRDLTSTSVVLKLWNGKKWIWTECGLVRLYKRTARQPGVRAEMLAGFPEKIEEYIIPPEEKCDICGGEMKVIEKRV